MSPVSFSRESRSGFTLVELLLVVAIIAIISAMAIPGLLTARISANEASAIATMRVLVSVNDQYRTRFQTFAGSLSDLWNAKLLDPSVADPYKAGYTFTYAVEVNSYRFNGDPTNPGNSGSRYFYVDPSGVIRYTTSGPADSNDPPLDG